MTFPSLFSLSRGLFSCPRHWSFLPLNLVNLAGPAPPSNVLSVCLSVSAGLGGSGPGEAKVGPGLSHSKRFLGSHPPSPPAAQRQDGAGEETRTDLHRPVCHRWVPALTAATHGVPGRVAAHWAPVRLTGQPGAALHQPGSLGSQMPSFTPERFAAQSRFLSLTKDSNGPRGSQRVPGGCQERAKPLCHPPRRTGRGRLQAWSRALGSRIGSL